jgi:hypothetical protein
MKKRTLFVILGLVIGTGGCSFSAGTVVTPTADEVGTIVAATMQTYTAAPGEGTATQAVTQTEGTPVSYENVSFVIPNGLASGGNAETMTALETNNTAPWDIAPTHFRFTLTGYPLQGKFHEPRIFVYPADEYAQINPNAAEQLDRLKKVLTGAIPLHETLPNVPFFNATAQISAQIKMISFQNGSGIRSLTQYAQYAAPINNHELFYHFQGLTSDTKYYLIAILPVTAPILPEDENPEATVPDGGVPIPTAVGPNDVYYFSVTEKLNSLVPEAFTPPLDMLDALIQSILITTP